MEDALKAKEKYKRQRARTKGTSSSSRGGPGLATQIKNYADNYRSSFLGTKYVGAGVNHKLYTSEPDRLRVLHQQEESSRSDRDRNMSSFKRAQRVVKKKLFDEDDKKIGMIGDLKEKLRLSNKQLRLAIN